MTKLFFFSEQIKLIFICSVIVSTEFTRSQVRKNVPKNACALFERTYFGWIFVWLTIYEWQNPIIAGKKYTKSDINVMCALGSIQECANSTFLIGIVGFLFDSLSFNLREQFWMESMRPLSSDIKKMKEYVSFDTQHIPISCRVLNSTYLVFFPSSS